MIISLTEAKTFLQIPATVSTYDDLINQLIPHVEVMAMERTRNFFHAQPQLIGAGISFAAATKTITNIAGNFLSLVPYPLGTRYGSIVDNDDLLETYILRVKFQAGMYVHIEQSLLNDGIHLIKSVPDGNTIVLDDNDTVFDESMGMLVRITRMNFKPGLKLAFSRLIGFYLIKNYGVKSKSLGDYSETYKNEDEAYDQILKPYRRVTG